MGVVETALLRLAGSVVAPAVRRWLGRRREQRERETPLIELIGTGITDDLGVRRAGRRLDDIVDTVYERLQPLVRRREPALPDNEVAAALDAVADTLRAADLSDAAVFADDVDPALMATRLRRQLPDVPDRAGLSEAAVHLYGRVLDECCTCLTQLVVQLGPFQARATVQTLERLTAVADGLTQVLARLPVTSLDAPTGTSHDAQFRTRYLAHLLTVLDHLELFGVDVHRYRLRTPLSIAYISLAVTGGNTRSLRRGGFRWDPGLLRSDGGGDSASVRAEQALGDAARVLLRGDAGSGKTTLMQWIAVTAARHGFTGELDSWNGRTPFLIRLRDHVTQPLPAPERFLDPIAATIAGLMPPGWVHRQLGTRGDPVRRRRRRGARRPTPGGPGLATRPAVRLPRPAGRGHLPAGRSVRPLAGHRRVHLGVPGAHGTGRRQGADPALARSGPSRRRPALRTPPVTRLRTTATSPTRRQRPPAEPRRQPTAVRDAVRAEPRP